MTDQEHNLVATRRNSKPRVFDTIAVICRILNDFGAILSIGWQKSGSMLACRYVVVNRSPMLIVDIFQHESDRLTISLSNGDHWQVNHDQLMPDYAHDLAYEIRSAIRKIKSVKFKQEALQPEGSDHE
jgi:hypothetical protein